MGHPAEAVRWYLTAAKEDDDKYAQFALGRLYANGIGVAQACRLKTQQRRTQHAEPANAARQQDRRYRNQKLFARRQCGKPAGDRTDHCGTMRISP